MDVRIVREDFPHVKEVDAKLVVLAKKVGGRIVTNDLNLKTRSRNCRVFGS
ncbi:MAG: hypothetical protein MRJ92_12900 [Nitrospira sp.]|nr:hypothetical protein [Nitrospira sp.]